MPGFSKTRALPALIGVPWKSSGRGMAGCDCWGIVRLGARVIYGVQFPSYLGYGDADDVKQAAQMFELRALWWPVESGTERDCDVVVLRIAGTPAHAGLVVGAGVMLHSLAGRNSCVERYRAPAWVNRIEGFYRWRPR